jgi:hypothetical protein
MTASADRMTAEDLARARALLGLSPAELAAEMGLTEHVVRAWEDGSLRIPREYALQIAFRAAIAERQAALASSGLPECAWVARWMESTPRGPGERAHFEALRRHAAACPACTARARFIETNFPPMPELPVPAPIRAMRVAGKWLEKRPPWLRAIVVGAGAATVFGVLRLAGMAINGVAPSPTGALLFLLLWILSGAYLGAVATLAYVIVRDPLRRLGRLGDYVAGILCTWVFLLAALIPAQYLTGRPAFPTPAHAVMVAVGGALIGTMIAQLWFRRH